MRIWHKWRINWVTRGTRSVFLIVDILRRENYDKTAFYKTSLIPFADCKNSFIFLQIYLTKKRSRVDYLINIQKYLNSSVINSFKIQFKNIKYYDKLWIIYKYDKFNSKSYKLLLRQGASHLLYFILTDLVACIFRFLNYFHSILWIVYILERSEQTCFLTK